MSRRDRERWKTGRNVYIEERCGDWRQVDILKRESGDWRQVEMSIHRREMWRLETGRYIKKREWRLETVEMSTYM